MQDKLEKGELLKIADNRLHPSITNPAYLVLRRRREILDGWLRGISGDHLTVLDVGGRYQPYRPLIEGRLRRYVALDVTRTELVDVVGSGEKLPFRCDMFDLVIATSVFDCFAEPRAAANEIHRVLKPGGHLLMSVSGVCQRFVDIEHWRFLPAGLKFTLAPFSKVTIVPEVTSVGGLFRFNAGALSSLARYEFLRQILHHTVVPVLNLTGLLLEGARISSNDQLSSNYAALAEK
jgi:SAM-dependent methyltransferase